MNEVFKDILDVCVVVYLDDILVYSDHLEEHLKHVREVLQRLCANNLYAKVEKCTFNIDTTDFLGFVIGPDGLRMDGAKIQAIRDWPTPKKVKEVQSFLGFANFYRCFIASYSDITVPLTRLMRKDAPWVWSPLCEDAFQLLKTVFTSAPILHHSTHPFLPSLKQTLPTTPSLAFYRYVQRMEKFTPSRSLVVHYPAPSSTTTPMTRNCSPFSRPSRPGSITSSPLITQLMLSQTTRIWNTSL